MTKVASFNDQGLQMSMCAVAKAGVRCHDFYKALFRTFVHGASASQMLTPARSHSFPPVASPRSVTSSQRSSWVPGRTGFAVIEVVNIVKPKKEHIYDLLREFQPGCPVTRYEGPKAYARVCLVEEDIERIKDLIKQLGRNSGNKDVQVRRVQARTP